MGSTKKGYLPTLDGWRAIAILAVIVDHASGYAFEGRFPRLLAITRIGPNGVSLFFAISGFLICSRLLEELARNGRVSLAGFYLRRASRILPAALAYLVAIGLLSWLGIIVVSWREWWSSALFFRNYLPPSLITRGWGGYTIHYWSLAVEEHFYLIWPGLLVLSGARRGKWVAGGMAVAIACWRSWDLRNGLFDQHLAGILFGSRTDTRLDGLLMGCFFALLFADPAWRVHLLRLAKPWLWASAVAAYACLQVYYGRHYYTLLESGLLGFIVSTTVLMPGTWVGKFLELSPMQWIGRLSYSLYLWQQLFFVPDAKRPWSAAERLPWNCLLLLGVALVSYRFVERPMIRWGHKLAPPPSPGREDLQEEPGRERCQALAA